MDITLQVSAISKSYGPIQALKNVSFTVPRGSVFGILGPNGSGKSTLLGIMLQILQANNGTIQWISKEGMPLSRHQLGAFLETPNFYHYMSGYNNLKITSAISGRGTIAEIDAILDQLKLAHRKNSKFSTYSLGMKQRLAIAAALLGNPSILILDEPTNGLDPNGIIEIRQLIRKLVEERGKTVFISSHLLSEVEKMVSHIGIINRGKLLFQGTIEELNNLSKKQLEIQTNDLISSKELLCKHGHQAEISKDKILIPYQTLDQSAEINSLLVRNDHKVYHLGLSKQNLENLFLSITQI